MPRRGTLGFSIAASLRVSNDFYHIRISELMYWLRFGLYNALKKAPVIDKASTIG